MRAQKAYTLAEMIVVVLVLATMAVLAAPRLPFGFVRQRQAEMTAWKIVTDLRRTRSQAILEAASNPDGFTLNIDRAGGSITYEIVNCGNGEVIDSHALESGVDLSGRMRFEFNPLGTLKETDDPTLQVSATGQTFTITVIPATGMVRCVQD